jgi:pSer/pThr/pTyr-binding forkhead associated (FHA) protein
VLDDDYASGRHARIFPQDGIWWLEDLGSTNGTLLGGNPVTGTVQLPMNTPVRIGQTTLELRP